MREILKLGLILLIITTVAAAVLGFTNEVTKTPIENQIMQANVLARQSVLPDAEEFEALETEIFNGYDNILEVYKGLQNGTSIGYTIKANSNGYGGPIEVMIGIGLDGIVHGVSVGNHTETPGLGAKAAEDSFKGQYTGKSTDAELVVIKSGVPKDNEIQSIAGATISSRAVTNSVNMAVRLFNEKLK
ncbi:RnfABCDGE type electron transport complex subunit G [Geosporobacter ferrireducens]|uniref:Ion-translocating oxidoreductase complex subunit G n=1 Tax=Geosporobacter ferrireducens TaxID=1424294 RepID=A0A1D8GPB8_9FIRM|nr:RnfABCDGE type electron transport complex subunit G [Geosporobacter ferrireducens]AOT72743.1 electron transporter [Geosporobacter ferrireducens]MTI55157.1 RnfABCDGE type electron transport complex subunit G [Geosporobacter ferrireducens]